MDRNYNFNSIGDLLDYRNYLKSQIKEYSKSLYFSSYVLCCLHMLKIVNILIRKKGYK